MYTKQIVCSSFRSPFLSYSSMLLLQEVEKDVKARTKGDLGAAKTLCTPFDQPDLPEGMVSDA
jgi:hypothetical protein